MKRSFFLTAMLALLNIGCAVINVNQYQDGRTLGEGELEADLGVDMGITMSDAVKLCEINLKTSSGYYTTCED